MLALDQLIAQLSFDTDSQQTLAHARALRARMSRLMPVLSALESVLHAMRTTPGRLSSAALTRTATHLQARQPADADLRSPCSAASATTRPTCLPRNRQAPSRRWTRRPLYHDHAMLLFGAVSADWRCSAPGCCGSFRAGRMAAARWPWRRSQAAFRDHRRAASGGQIIYALGPRAC
jgi:hypothetical protein